jgi:nucleotide-binding universal stress UspA family protein
MIKSILVALDGSEHANAALDHALWMAERTRGRVTGLHVIDIVSIEGSFMHDISGSLGFEPYLDFSAKMRDALRERGEVLLDAFEKRCKERSVGCDRVLGMGIVANEICEQARLADLVAIGHRGINEQFSSGLLGSTTESVTRKSPKPVFVAPMKFAEPKRPLLAYDGSQRSSLAMHEAAEFASAFKLPLTGAAHGARRGRRAEGAGRGAALSRAVRPRDTLRVASRAVARGHRPGHPAARIRPALHRRVRPLAHHRDGARQHDEYVLRNSPCPCS